MDSKEFKNGAKCLWNYGNYRVRISRNDIKEIKHGARGRVFQLKSPDNPKGVPEARVLFCPEGETFSHACTLGILTRWYQSQPCLNMELPPE